MNVTCRAKMPSNTMTKAATMDRKAESDERADHK